MALLIVSYAYFMTNLNVSPLSVSATVKTELLQGFSNEYGHFYSRTGFTYADNTTDIVDQPIVIDEDVLYQPIGIDEDALYQPIVIDEGVVDQPRYR